MTSPTIAVRVLRAPRARRADAVFLTATVMLGLVALAAVFAPFVAPHQTAEVLLSLV